MVQILFHQQYGVIGMLILPHFLGLKKSPWKHGPQCCQHCRFVHGKGHITLHRLANTKGQNLSIEMVGLAILRMRTQHLPDISRLFHKNLGKMLRIWHMFFGRGAHPEFTRFHLRTYPTHSPPSEFGTSVSSCKRCRFEAFFTMSSKQRFTSASHLCFPKPMTVALNSNISA